MNQGLGGGENRTQSELQHPQQHSGLRETPVCVPWGQNLDHFSTEHPATDRRVTMGFTRAIHSPTSCTLCACQLPRGSSSVVKCRGSLQGNHKASPAGAAGKGRKTGVRSGRERGFKPQESFSGLGWGLWPGGLTEGPLDMARGYQDHRLQGWQMGSKPCPQDHGFSSEQMYFFREKCLRQGLAM